MYPPVTIRWDDIIDPELLADLLDTQVRHVGIELLSSHGRRDGSGKIHEACSLVLRSIAPSVALATLLGAVRIELRFFPLRAAATLGVTAAISLWPVVITEATPRTKRNGIRASLTGVVPPRHDGDGG